MSVVRSPNTFFKTLLDSGTLRVVLSDSETRAEASLQSNDQLR